MSANVNYKARTIPQRLQTTGQTYPSAIMQYAKNADGVFETRTWDTFLTEMYRIAHFFKQVLGVTRNDKVALISHNRAEWLLFDIAVLGLGAVDVPRGSDTVPSEISYILSHSDAIGAVFENAEVYKAVEKHDPAVIQKLRFVVFIDTPQDYEKNKKTYNPNKSAVATTLHEIAQYPLQDSDITTIQQEIEKGTSDDLATIIYTSGTTALPKGVCLAHRGFLSQIDAIVPDTIHLKREQVFLSVLPVWHAYEREIQYIVLSSGCSIAYSKPIGKILLNDLATTQAHWMTSVPRIWEGVYAAIHRKVRKGSAVKRIIFNAAVAVGRKHAEYRHKIKNTFTPYTTAAKKTSRRRMLQLASAIPLFIALLPLRIILDMLVFKKIRALLGSRFVAGVSGGGALPHHIDWFFQAARITIVEGYGLTETSPVLSVRHQSNPEANSIGKILQGIEYKIVNRETKQAVEDGTPGILFVRCPQVMIGYYKDPQATAQVLDTDGWLNTGDIVIHDSQGPIKIVERATEMIVLSNGENVSPTRVENTIKESEYIDNAIVFGQDKKYIGALITLAIDVVIEYTEHNAIFISDTTSEALSSHESVLELVSEQISACNAKLNSHERIIKYRVIPHAFEVGEELTQTLKLKRHFIEKKYSHIIESLF